MNREGSVLIDAKNFQDLWFREGIRCCDKDENGVLSKEKINFVTKIRIRLDRSEEITSKNSWKRKRVFEDHS